MHNATVSLNVSFEILLAVGRPSNSKIRTYDSHHRRRKAILCLESLNFPMLQVEGSSKHLWMPFALTYHCIP